MNSIISAFMNKQDHHGRMIEKLFKLSCHNPWPNAVNLEGVVINEGTK